MNELLVKRIKSFIWRAGAMASVAVAAYVLNVGDVFKLDYHILINLAVLAVAGLVVAEVTKYLNTNA